jgi:hypothetical protein
VLSAKLLVPKIKLVNELKRIKTTLKGTVAGGVRSQGRGSGEI